LNNRLGQISIRTVCATLTAAGLSVVPGAVFGSFFDGAPFGNDNSDCGPYPELERACCDDAECTADTLAALRSRARRGEGEAIRGLAKAFLDGCLDEHPVCEDEY